MQFATNKNVVVLSLAGGALSIFAAYYISSQILVFASSAFFLLSIIVWKFGYLLAPFLGSSFNLCIKGDGFELSQNQDSLIKQGEHGYTTTSFLSITLRDSTGFKSDGQKAALMEMFERSLSSLRHMLKISLIACPVNMSDYTQKLEEKRSLAEHRKSQSKDSAQISLLEREIQQYSSQLERLASGDAPMQVLAYAQTSAFGLTKEEALSRVRSQAKEAQSVLSSTLASDVKILQGEDLLQCATWEHTPPTSPEQISSSLF
ncbi:MAG: hypothetical protein V1822_01140 [Candidatus Micrarchaeota archaeon]